MQKKHIIKIQSFALLRHKNQHSSIVS